MTKNMKTRLISGFLAAPVVVLMYFNYYSLLLLASVVVFISSGEYYKMAITGNNIKLTNLLSLFSGSSIFLYGLMYDFYYKGELNISPTIIFYTVFFLCASIILLKIKKIDLAKDFLTASLFNVFYISFFLSFFANIYIEYKGSMALLAITSVWFYDIGAYFFGIRFGKHKLAPIFSPKKSWEGFFGGLLTTFVFIFIFEKVREIIFNQEIFNISTMVLFAILVAIFDTIGDLTESTFKRFFNKKDAGDALPGHGGILDRIDGLLIAAPAWYILLKILGI